MKKVTLEPNVEVTIPNNEVKKSEKKEEKHDQSKELSNVSNEDTVKIITENSKISEEKLRTDVVEDIISPKSFSNNHTYGDKKWIVAAASSIGNSHLKSNTPCQDNHFCESLGNGWGLIICCDGAGSAKNSHFASKFISNEVGANFFKKLVAQSEWYKDNVLPSSEDWEKAARKGFEHIYRALEKYSVSEQMELKSLASTATVLIYSPVGLLVSHIGDGRAGYCNKQGEWKSVLIPHKGEEANQTVFITSDRWLLDTKFKMSGVSVPESRVINEKPIAFTALTDGCELHSFECSILDMDSKKWMDPNVPFAKFFDPLVNSLSIMTENKLSGEEIDHKWQGFIEGGTKGLSSEPDDKTMIIGVLN